MGVSDGNRLPLWTYVDNMRSQQNIRDNDLSDVKLGSVKPEGEKQAIRHQMLCKLSTM